MALYGSHLRFAEDVKNDFHIKDENKYFSGTVYPDSRYYTKIERNLAHDKRYLERSFYIHDDFRKGWAVHLLYDDLQFSMIDKLFPELFDSTGIKYGNNNWITRTVLKILQDMDDVKNCDIGTLVKHLKYIETPNREEAKLIEKYNQRIIEVYSRSGPLTINDYFYLGQPMEMKGDILEKLNDEIITMQRNLLVMEKISFLYDHTFNAYKDMNREDTTLN
jgi:hypothetical protein